MEIKKVANLSEEEFKALVTAGEIIGTINKAFEAGTIDTLSEEALNLVKALANVCAEVTSR